MSDKTALADLRPGQWIMQPPGPDFRPSETVNYDRVMRVTLNPGVTEVELEFSHRKLSSSVVKDGVTVIPGGPPDLALTWNPYPGTWVLSATSTKPTLVVEVDGRDVHVENGSADSKVWVVLRDDAQSAAVLDAINDRIEQLDDQINTGNVGGETLARLQHSRDELAAAYTAINEQVA